MPNIEETLRAKNIDFVSFEDWQRLDQLEIENGEAKDKVREKFSNVSEMMTAIHKLRL